MKIKQAPEEFKVEEIFPISLKKEGEYTYFILKKKNWTTMRAIQQIARKLGVSKTRFGFAGNKDKNALTSQIISAWRIDPDELKKIQLKDIEIEVIGKGNKRICLGEHYGNKFEILVRDLRFPERVINGLNLIKKYGFPNYYGEQRFGSAKNTHLIGKAIISGDLEGAVRELLTKGSGAEGLAFAEFARNHWGQWKEILKKCPKFLGLEKAVLNWLVKHPRDFAGALRKIPKPTRKIFVHAYQSHIWNQKLSKLIKSNVPCRKIDFADGSYFVPTYQKFNFKNKKIKMEGVECKKMPELSMSGFERWAFVLPQKLNWKYKNKKLLLKFELPKGSYATVLLKCLEMFDESQE